MDVRAPGGSSIVLRGMTLTGGSALLASPEEGGGLLTGVSSAGQIHVRVEDCVVTGNQANSGGGLLASDTDLTILRSTISNNHAVSVVESGSGGGAYFYAGSARIQSSTIAGNDATGGAGAVAWSSLAEVSIEQTTIAANSAAIGSIFSTLDAANLRVRDSILAGDCNLSGVTTPQSGGGNLESPGDTCGLSPSDQVRISGAALGLGASVKVFDKSIYRLRRLQSDLAQRIYTSVIQPDELRRALQQADVAVGALRPEHGRTPMVVNEDMVREMKNGAVIVDVSIDRGGCFETSRITNLSDPVFKKFGVVHYCVPNIASRVPRTASYALTNIFTPLLLGMGDVGGFEELIKRDLGLRHGVYLFNGALTSEVLSEAFRLPYKDLDILLAAF
jgi:hypothetical protein